MGVEWRGIPTPHRCLEWARRHVRGSSSKDGCRSLSIASYLLKREFSPDSKRGGENIRVKRKLKLTLKLARWRGGRVYYVMVHVAGDDVARSQRAPAKQAASLAHLAIKLSPTFIYILDIIETSYSINTSKLQTTTRTNIGRHASRRPRNQLGRRQRQDRRVDEQAGWQEARRE